MWFRYEVTFCFRNNAGKCLNTFHVDIFHFYTQGYNCKMDMRSHKISTKVPYKEGLKNTFKKYLGRKIWLGRVCSQY